MSVIGDTLFLRRDGGNIHDVIRTSSERLRQHVDQFDERQFDRGSDEEVVAALAKQLRIEPLLVDFDNSTKAASEIQVEVEDHFGGRTRVPGLLVTKSFPFTGDRELWNIGTGTWGSVMPRGEISSGRLMVGMEVRANDGDTAVNHINSTIEQIRGYLAQQREPIDAFNQALPVHLLPLVQERRKRRGAADDLMSRF